MQWWRWPDGPAARYARPAGVGLGSVAAIAAAVFLLVPLLARAFVHGVELLTAGCIWVATSISVGVSVWTLIGTIGRSAEGALVTPAASAVLAVLVLVGLLALVALQRLLGVEDAEEEER